MLRKTGIIISIALGLILASAAICTAISLIFPEMHYRVIALISDNWLIIIFKIHAKIINAKTNLLHEIKFHDIFILALFTLIGICLYFAFDRQKKIWFVTAISLPVLGIVILVITHLAGRSAFMASGLIISIILVSKGYQKRITGLTGILANSLLLIGDFTVGFDSKIISVLFGLGYILETIWIFMIAFIFMQTENQKQTMT